MITFAFDRKGPHGFVPNLVTRTDIVPKSDDWWDLCITPPFSYEFRLMRYMEMDGVPYSTVLVNDIVEDTGPVTYPINLNFFDPEIDYIGLISNEAQELCRQGTLKILFYYSEGDNPKSHIENNLQAMCETHKIPMENIRFVIANRAAHSKGPFIYFPDDELYYRYLHVREKDYVKQVNSQPRSKVYTCLNRMDKPFRKVFASSLWYHGLVDNGYFSYLGMNYTREYKETLKDPIYKWNNHWHNLDQLFSNFDMHAPFLTDELDDNAHNNHKLIDHRFYTDAYFNFVVETHFSKNNVFLTEKTFKPILNMQPFIIVGAPGSLKLLRELGYETFGDWVDEGYDGVKKDENRMFDVFATAYELNGKTQDELMAMTKEMIPILAHNQQVFLDSKKAPLEKLIKQII
jgi:hypothetical protein